MRSRPSYSCATGTVPFTIHTASGAISSNSARASPPPNASNTRRTPSSASAFKRSHRQPVSLELRVVQLGELAMAGPHERLPARVDLVRERHPLVVVDAGDGLGERERDALERVVVVVEHDHAPRVARPGAAGAARAQLRRSQRLRHDGSRVAITASAITFSGRPDT